MESDRIELRRKRDFGSTINVVFEFIRKNWRPMGKSLLFIVGPVLLVASVVSGFYLRGILGMVDSLGRYGDSPPANPLAIFNDVWPVLILSAISGVISTIFLFAVVSGYVRLYVASAPATLDVDDVWGEVRSSFWRVTATMIFAIIITSLPTLVLMLPALIFREPALVVLIILAIVPTIYIYNCFTILIAMRLEEEIGLFEAVRRCINLMKGRWWFSFWITVVMAFVVMFVSMIFQVPLQVSMGVATFAGSEGTGWILFIGVALSTIGSYLMYSILILSCSVLYYNLVEHKEGVGMAERISEIGAGSGVADGASGATSL